MNTLDYRKLRLEYKRKLIKLNNQLWKNKAK